MVEYQPGDTEVEAVEVKKYCGIIYDDLRESFLSSFIRHGYDQGDTAICSICLALQPTRNAGYKIDTIKGANAVLL